MTELNRHQDEVGRKCFDTLIEMMETMPLDSISTSKIIDKSQVSRSTFYRRYQDKYDLLNKSYELILNDTLYSVVRGNSYKKSFFALYSVLNDHPKFFKNAFSSKDHNNLRNYIYEKSMDTYLNMLNENNIDIENRYNKLMLHGFITGTLEITVQWALNEMDLPIDQIFKLCYDLMPDEIKRVIALIYM